MNVKTSLASLVRKWCAVENVEDVPDDESGGTSLQLRFLGGRNARTAKIAAAPVLLVPGEADRVTRIAEQRISIVHEQNPVCYVRVYRTGGKAPMDSLVIAGGADDDDDDDDSSAGNAGIMGETARVIKILVNGNRELLEQCGRLAQERQDLAVESATLLVHSMALQESQSGERLVRGLQAMEPTLRAVMPALLTQLLSRNDGAPRPLPTEAVPTVNGSLDAIERNAESLVVALSSLSGEERAAALQVVEQRLAPLAMVLEQLRASSPQADT